MPLSCRHYHMALSDNIEIHDTKYGVYERKIGSLLSAFLNVEWKVLCDECDIFSDYYPQGNQLEDFVEWYKKIEAMLSDMNPAFLTLVSDQFINVIRNVLGDYGLEMQFNNIDDIFRYLSHDISEVHIRTFAKDIAKRLSNLANFKNEFINLVEDVLDCTKTQEDILTRYIRIREQTRYQSLSNKYYPLLILDFSLDSGNLGKKHRSNSIPGTQNSILKSYFSTEDIAALVLWEFDYMAANNIAVKKCEYCGRYFRPFSKNTLFCDNLVDGTKKTCKEVGAMTKYQRSIESKDAKKLYNRVNNRLSMFAKRSESHGYVEGNYDSWKRMAKAFLELVENEEMTYDEFEKSINIKSNDLRKKLE